MRSVPTLVLQAPGRDASGYVQRGQGVRYIWVLRGLDADGVIGPATRAEARLCGPVAAPDA